MGLEDAKQELHSKYKKYIAENKENIITSFDEILDVPRYTTGDIGLDEIFGGGVPKGRLLRFFGPESGGKTTISTFIASTFQKAGLSVLYIDAEQTMDHRQSKKAFGFDVTDKEHVHFSQIELLPLIYETIETYSKNGLNLAIVDSTDAMLTDAEEEGDYGDAHMGQASRGHSQGLKKIKKTLNQNGTSVIFVSQLRTKIGAPKNSNPETVSGGKAINFYASVTARVSKVDFIMLGDKVIGQRIRVKTIKNKTAPPFQEVILEYYYNSGIQPEKSMLAAAVKYGLVTKKAGGNYVIMNGEEELKFRGEPNVINYLQEHKEIYKMLEDKVRIAIKENPIVEQLHETDIPEEEIAEED